MHGTFSKRNRVFGRDRRGAIAVLTAFFLIAVMAIVACAIDLGYLLVARAEMQRSADAAAVAAVADMADHQQPEELVRKARDTAVRYASLNVVLNSPPKLSRNSGNKFEGDVVVGTIEGFGQVNPPLLFGDAAAYNAVKVRVRRTAQENGEVPLFFARVLGVNSRPLDVSATAAIMKRIGGFRPPESGENLPILPIAMHLDCWNELLEGDDADDDFAYNEQDGSVSDESDGIPEAFLFPERNGSPGNLGTVDIGPASNSTSHLRQQIQSGISEADLAHHGGELKFNDQGEMLLGGDPGLSAGMESALRAIVGEKRAIPIFSEVSGQGDNAVYTIVRFAGVRIMEVELSGHDKRIYVQPTKLFIRGTIPTDLDGTSDYIYSNITLVD